MALALPIYQNGLQSSQVYDDLDASPRERGVRRAAEQAIRLGLAVMLKPLLLAGRSSWRGAVVPDDWGAWFQSYGAVNGRLAQLASEINAVDFVVGSEMESAASQTERWSQLIGEARKRFGGRVHYFANFDGYQKVGSWNELDVVGVDAYPPVAKDPSAPGDELVGAWLTWWRVLDAWRRSLRRLVLIGEVGFSSNPRTVVSPFGGGGSGDQPDMEAQRSASTATVQALRQFQDLAGAYWWAWEPRPRAGGALDATFTPQNKPALGVLTEWLHDELRGPAPVAARP